jgi:hypothetical protein
MIFIIFAYCFFAESGQKRRRKYGIMNLYMNISISVLLPLKAFMPHSETLSPNLELIAGQSFNLADALANRSLMRKGGGTGGCIPPCVVELPCKSKGDLR